MSLTSNIEAAATEGPTTKRARLSRRVWITIAVAATVVTGDVVTAVSISNHYLDAPGLATSGGGWLPPDNATLRSVNAGSYSASIAVPRPGQRQTFEFDLYNAPTVER